MNYEKNVNKNKTLYMFFQEEEGESGESEEESWDQSFGLENEVAEMQPEGKEREDEGVRVKR